MEVWQSRYAVSSDKMVILFVFSISGPHQAAGILLPVEVFTDVVFGQPFNTQGSLNSTEAYDFTESGAQFRSASAIITSPCNP